MSPRERGTPWQGSRGNSSRLPSRELIFPARRADRSGMAHPSARSSSTNPSVGHLLAHWRKTRNLSQLALAHEADVSPRHVSFVETGRTKPSRAMVLHLAQTLGVPLR